MNRKEISSVLASAGLRPQHQFGQNFMVDEGVLKAVAEAGEIGAEDVVLEVGPGVGNLTRVLSGMASRGAVLAVDIDRKLLPAAKSWHGGLKNVTWMLADVLAGKHAVNPEVMGVLAELHEKHLGGEVKLVSNLPYNVASPLIAEILVGNAKLKTQISKPGVWISRLAFTVQWEVGTRMAAEPGTRDYGALGVLIQALAKVEIVRKIPPGAFWPAPKVNSALVVVVPDAEKIDRVADVLRLQKLLSGAFGHRRQTLGNALKHYFQDEWRQDRKERLVAAGFDLGKRPEELSVEEWLRVDAVLAE